MVGESDTRWPASVLKRRCIRVSKATGNGDVHKPDHALNDELKSALKAAFDRTYRELLSEDSDEDELKKPRSPIRNQESEENLKEAQSIPAREPLFTCNFCKSETFSDKQACFDHVGKCVYNPREDPFVKGGIISFLQNEPRKRKRSKKESTKP